MHLLKLLLAACALALPLLAAEPPRLLPTMIKAEHYAALRESLIPGDIVFAFAVRNPGISGHRALPRQEEPRSGPGHPPAESAWNEERFTQRLNALNAIQDRRLEKMVVFSSLEDFKANRERLPSDLRWIGYNTEPGMTPANELTNLQHSVPEFARLCHAKGWKLHWAPVSFRTFDDSAALAAIVPAIDGILLQHQRSLEMQGHTAFAQLTSSRVALIKKLNPKCKVDVQVAIGRGPEDELIQGLKAVAPLVDGCSIWTMRDTDAVARVLKSVR